MRSYRAGKKPWYSYSTRRYYGANWGSTSRKAIGSAAAAKTGTKLTYYNAQVSGYATFNFDAGSFTSDVHSFHPYTCAITMSGSGSSATYSYNEEKTRHGGAVFDKGFRLNCAMNDECRLVKMTVKLQPANTVPNNAAIRLYSTIDRNLTREEFLRYYSGDSMMDDTVTAKDIIENQGAIVQTFNANRVAPLYRTSVPTDLKEKTAWADCSIKYTTSAGQSPLKDIAIDGWYTNKTDYAPCFHYCCQSSVAPSVDSTFIFGYTVEYCFAFRNPKSGLDTFIKLEQIGYTNPASKSLPAVDDPKNTDETDDPKPEPTDDIPK